LQLVDKDMRALLPDNIQQLKPYVAGKTIAEVEQEYKPEQIAKLASNENRLGCSEAAKQAAIESLAEIQDYPDPIARTLRAKIAQRNEIQPGQVLLTHGSESLISHLTRTFFADGEVAITGSATFVGFFVQANIQGVPMKQLPMTDDFRFDVPAILDAIDESTKMIYIANPNNPTGTYINKSEFEQLMDGVPEDVVVVMDEAYFEYAESIDDYPQALTYGYPNVMTLRTFSKAYGLAGLRIGYAMGPEKLISALYKTKLVFEPTTPAQAAAQAAMDDTDFLNRSIDVVEQGRERLYEFFDEQDVQYVRSASNSVMAVFETEEEASTFNQGMLEQGVILRQLGGFGLPNCVRITIGLPEEMDYFKSCFSNL
jgi:histidinol-phosphate aminotransferase